MVAMKKKNEKTYAVSKDTILFLVKARRYMDCESVVQKTVLRYYRGIYALGDCENRLCYNCYGG